MDDGKASGGTITSVDGTRTITVEEFDRLFDEGSDEIDGFIDWSKAKRVGSERLRRGEDVYLSWPFTRDLVDRVEAEAARLGTTSSDLVARWLTERLDRLAAARDARAHDHAAE